MIDDLNKRKNVFKKIWVDAYKKYSSNNKRLAGEGWEKDWQLLIATMLSAQSRDEITIPVAESLFKKYSSLKKLDDASEEDIKNSIIKINYNLTKAKHIKKTVKILIEKHGSTIPRHREELINLPGVGIKTANLVLGELFDEEAICVDTHVHRISNVFGFVKTKTPEQTEKELQLVVPRKYWNKINRIFVLWGQDVKGNNSDDFLKKLKK